MKVSKELNYPIKVKAVLDEDGNLDIALTAVAPYGNRTVTATINTFSEEIVQKVSEVLMDVIVREGGRVVQLAEHEAITAQAKAIALGEVI